MKRAKRAIIPCLTALFLALSFGVVLADPYLCCDACPNTATTFEGAWAFRSYDGIHLCWVTGGEFNSRRFDVYAGADRKELVASVEPEGGDKMHFYEISVAAGYEFEVVEIDDRTGIARGTRTFAVGRPPEAIESLRMMNATVDGLAEQAKSYPLRPAPDAALASSVVVTDYVFYSSRQDFLDATLPVRNYYSSKGRTSQTILGTNDPNDCKAAMQAIWQEAIATGYPRLPFLVIVGNAYEDVFDSRNVVGTIYYPDTGGNCYFAGGCASDVRIVDFDGDDLPDTPWTRILGTNLTEINNTVQSALYYYGGQHIKPNRAFIMIGDLDDTCSPVPEPRATMDQIVAAYQADGLPTVVRSEDDDYVSCVAYADKLADVQQIMQGGITEMLGTGWTTNRSKLPGWIIQKVYTPVFTMAAVPYPQLFVAEFPGCELAGEDRLNPSYYPTIMQMFMTADPDVYATAVAWFGHKRGGWESDHLQFALSYFENRLAVYDQVTTLHDVYFNTIREVGLDDPTQIPHLLLCGAYGWPVQLPDMIPPPPPPPGGGCPYLYVFDGNDYRRDNTLLRQVPRDVAGKETANVSDAYVLQVQPAAVDGAYKVEFREFEKEHSYIDRVRLYAIDHPTDTELAVMNDGHVVVHGDWLLPTAARSNRDEDLLETLSERDGASFEGKAGDEVVLTYPVPNGVSVAFGGVAKKKHEIEAGGQDPMPGAPVGIEALVSIPGQEGYVSLGNMLPREYGAPRASFIADQILGNAAGADEFEVRLVWHTDHDLDFAGLFTPIEVDPAEATVAMKNAVHSSKANEQVRLAEADGAFAELTPGQTLSLEFAEVSAVPDGMKRSFLLRADGHYTASPESNGDTPVPTVLKLHPNQPNPFNPTTTIRFDLPERARVALRVYSVSGQLVATLTDRVYPAGQHNVVWDGRDARGSRVASGVYFYTLQSPAGNQTRKMTLLK